MTNYSIEQRIAHSEPLITYPWQLLPAGERVQVVGGGIVTAIPDTTTMALDIGGRTHHLWQDGLWYPKGDARIGENGLRLERLKVVGRSLSFCVVDIMEGRVREDAVERIVASTKAPDFSTFEDVLERYADLYWKANPALGKEIAIRLWEAGKIDQPRLRGEEAKRITVGRIWAPVQ